MADRSVLALLRLEAARGLRYFRDGWVALVVLLAIVFLVFGRDADAWGMVLGVAGFVYGMSPMVRVLVDKLDGSLEFLTSLPVHPEQMALAHLMAAGAYALLAAVPWTIMVVITAPPFLEAPLGPFWYLGVFVGLWLGAILVSVVSGGLLVRLPVEAMNWVPMAVLGAVLGLGWMVDRLFPDIERTLVPWLLTPRSPLLLFSVLVAVEVLGLAAAFVLLRSGYRHFRPGAVALPPELDKLRS